MAVRQREDAAYFPTDTIQTPELAVRVGIIYYPHVIVSVKGSVTSPRRTLSNNN